MHLRRITGMCRNYLVALPANSCRRQHIGPGSSITLQVRVGPDIARFPARVLAWARSLHVTIPRPWRLSEGLRSGDSVLLLEVEPRVFELQIVEGASEKQLHRRGEVVALMRIKQARAESERRYAAGVRFGMALGSSLGYGELVRRRECFNPEHARSEEPEASA